MIRQLSVFVENVPGNIMKVTSALAEAGINVRAVSAFDTPEFGILRLVVDKPLEAKEYLTSKGFVVRVQDVIGVVLKDEQGNLNEMLKILAEAEVNISYIYSFVIRKNTTPVMVFSADDQEKAEKALTEAGITLTSENEL